jgi:ADP-L-glycero-D-manno-heptose 6-epimerase
MCEFFRENKVENGLYNIGTGKARTFLDLVHATFSAMGISPNIEFIDTPQDIRENYQYLTEANILKLNQAGYSKSVTSLEDGVRNYVQNYLMKGLTY